MNGDGCISFLGREISSAGWRGCFRKSVTSPPSGLPFRRFGPWSQPCRGPMDASVLLAFDLRGLL